MNKHFPKIVDTGFTAEMERKLDDVEEGRQSWTEFLHSFYSDFKVTMDKAEAEMDRVQKPVEEINEVCPECGRNLVIRTGRFGRFISCSGFPECRYRRSVVNKTGALCPVCQGDLVERKTKLKKRIFYGCNNYPTCNFAIWEKPVPELCPDCGGLMVVPRVGQSPVCYQEFVAQQRNAGERPEQNGAATRRGTRKKVTTTEDPSLLSQTPSANGRSSTTAKKTTTRTKRGRTRKATVATRAKNSTRGKKTASGTKKSTTNKTPTG
jgi:DNA topoisomerase-1